MTHRTAQELIAFEQLVKRHWEEGNLPMLIHLCGGNEESLIHIFKSVNPGDWVFSGHRSHYHYLLSGGSLEALLNKIFNGDSMFVFGAYGNNLQVNFLTSSVLSGTCCIAAGVAMQLKSEGSKNRVWCFLGDGAEDEGHFYEAVRFVQGHNLPCTFIIEDNNRSVDTSIVDRRGDRSHFDWPSCVYRYNYAPTYPHAGSGCKHHIQFQKEAISNYLQQKL